MSFSYTITISLKVIICNLYSERSFFCILPSMSFNSILLPSRSYYYPLGEKGDKGDIGLQGYNGIPGMKGELGPVGPQGKHAF